MNRPLLLLIATGIPLGLNFPLGKLAIAAGIQPALWAAAISLGAGLGTAVVNALLAWKDQWDPRHPHGEVRAERASNHEGFRGRSLLPRLTSHPSRLDACASRTSG